MSDSSAPAGPFRLGRCLLAAVSGFCFTLFFFSALETWREMSGQNWGDEGLGWLKIDYLARQLPWKKALAGGGLTLVLALVGEALRHSGGALAAPVGLMRWGTRWFGGAVGLALMLLLAAWPRLVAPMMRPAATEESRDILFVMVDTWRADHTGFLGYERDTWPGVRVLAEEGIVFERALTGSPWTKPTIATLFSAKVPSHHGAMSHMTPESGRRFVAMHDENLTMAETLRASGYETGGWSANTNIQDMYGFAQGFGHFEYHPIALADFMVGRAQEWIDDRKDSDRPFFAYVHIMDPHYPYTPPEGFAGTWDRSGLDYNLSYEVVKDFHEGRGKKTPEQVQRINDAYDEELLWVDSVVTPFIEKFQQEHPDALVVLVGDHGEEFWEHGRVGHGHVLYQELVHIPLVIWDPRLEAQRIEWQVPLLDLFPTLLEMAECGVPTSLDDLQGSSFTGLIDGSEQGHRPSPLETGGDGEPPWQLRGISMEYEGRLYKMIRQEVDYMNPNVGYALYDLEADPFEKKNLAIDPEYRPIVLEMFEEMKRRNWYVHPDERVGDVFDVSVVPEEDAQHLHDLGYAEFDTGDEDLEEEDGEFIEGQ